MPDLPPDLSRLGDALEQAVGRAIARRRAQLRAAWALGAVVMAMPMALVVAHLYVRTSDGPLPARTPVPALPTTTGEAAFSPAPERAATPRLRVAADRRPRRATHPLDHGPPPVGARAARGYDPGVATERVDRSPPFPIKPI